MRVQFCGLMAGELISAWGVFFYDWESVNHSVEFVSKTGCNTNRIEGFWSHLKKAIPNGSRRKDLDAYVLQYNFLQWLRNMPSFTKIGLFGYVCRLEKFVKLRDRGQRRDRIVNTQMFHIVHKLAPKLEEPSKQAPVAKKRGGGGRKKSRGRSRGRRSRGRN